MEDLHPATDHVILSALPEHWQEAARKCVRAGIRPRTVLAVIAAALRRRNPKGD